MVGSRKVAASFFLIAFFCCRCCYCFFFFCFFFFNGTNKQCIWSALIVHSIVPPSDFLSELHCCPFSAKSPHTYLALSDVKAKVATFKKKRSLCTLLRLVVHHECPRSKGRTKQIQETEFKKKKGGDSEIEDDDTYKSHNLHFQKKKERSALWKQHFSFKQSSYSLDRKKEAIASLDGDPVVCHCGKREKRQRVPARLSPALVESEKKKKPVCICMCVCVCGIQVPT